MKPIWKKLAFAAATAAIIPTALIFGINQAVKMKGAKYTVSGEQAPKADAILVLGARVFSDGGVSEMLRDRLEVALGLYEQGKAPKILVSGDHGRTAYDEVHAMRAYLTERGVPEENIFMDHAGFSTYESVYRAKAVFQAQKLVIVTQDYHLKRAIYNARRLGLEAFGVASDLNRYRGMARFELREVAARNKDFVFVNFVKPKPTYLGDVIPISGDGRATDDKKKVE